MARPTLEVAEIFRTHGPAWRQAQRGHLSLGQHKVMAAIERCRSAALGGHVLQCPACAHAEIAYNSCRNRHCPKCQGSAARRWLEDRQGDLLPVESLLSHLIQRDSPIPKAFSIQWFHHKTLNRKEESGYGLPSYCTSSASPIRAAT